MAYADERGRKEQEPSNPINLKPDFSFSFTDGITTPISSSGGGNSGGNSGGGSINWTDHSIRGSGSTPASPGVYQTGKEYGGQSDMLFPTDWGGTTIGPKEEEEPQHNDEPQDNPISAPKPVTPQKAEEPLPEEPVDTGASSRVPLPEPVEPIVPATNQGGRDDNEAFRRVVDRGNRSDDESEFWSGNPLFPTDYGGTTIPGMPGVSTPKPSPVTQDQFLEGASNFLNPLMNFGVRPAGAVSETPNTTEPTNTPGTSSPTPDDKALYDMIYNNAVRDGATPREASYIANEGVASWNNYNAPVPESNVNPQGTAFLRDNPFANVSSYDEAAARYDNQRYLESLGTPITLPNTRQAYDDMRAGNTNPLADAIVGAGNVVSNVLGNVVSGGFESPVTDNIGTNIVNDISNDLTRAGNYGNTSDAVLQEVLGEIAADPAYPTDAELAEAGRIAGQQLEDMGEAAYTNNPVNNPSTTETSGTSGRPSQTDIANYVYMLRSNPFLADIDRNLLSGMDFNTRNVILQGANNDYQNLMNNAIQDRLYTENAFVPMRNEGDISVSPDWRNGGDIGNVWQEVLNSEYFLDDNGMAIYINPDGTFTQPVVDADGNITYKPYTGNVHRQNKYSPDDILGFFLNENYGHPGHEGEPLFKGMEQMWENLTEEEKAGMNELLNTGIFGGSNYRDPNRNGVFDQEFANLSEAEYSRLAQLFYDNMPALQMLNENGLLNRYDENGNLYMDGYSSIIDFFFKAFKRDNAPKTPKNYKGGYSRRGGYGGRGRGGGGGGGGYGGYGSSSSSSNQRQNRVYNIMKNWSF